MKKVLKSKYWCGLNNKQRVRTKNLYEELNTRESDALNTKLAEAPSFGKTIIMHDAIGKASTSYLNLAREILQRNGLTKISDNNRMISMSESQELNEDL